MISFLAALVISGVANDEVLPSKPVSLDGGMSVSGKAFVPDLRKSKFTVFMFIAHDCPVANRYVPEIRRIESEYKKAGIGFYRVYMLEAEDADLVETHTEEFKLDFPAILDTEKKMVKSMGVRVTPEVVVVDPSGVMKYRGRIDDKNIEHGKIRENYREDLKVALNELLAGKVVSVPSTAAVGCFISGIDN